MAGRGPGHSSSSCRVVSFLSTLCELFFDHVIEQRTAFRKEASAMVMKLQTPDTLVKVMADEFHLFHHLRETIFY